MSAMSVLQRLADGRGNALGRGHVAVLERGREGHRRMRRRHHADRRLEIVKGVLRHIRRDIGCELQFILLRQDGRDAGGLDKTILLDAGNAEDLLPDQGKCEEILNDIAEYEMTRPEKSSVPLLRAAFARKHLELVSEAKPVAPCVAPRTFATVFPDGGTSLCEIVLPHGNLKDFDYDLIAAWNSKTAEDQRAQLSSCWCTYPCALHTSIMRDPDALSDTLKLVKRDLR